MTNENKSSDPSFEWSLLFFTLSADERTILRCEMIRRIVRARGRRWRIIHAQYTLPIVIGGVEKNAA